MKKTVTVVALAMATSMFVGCASSKVALTDEQKEVVQDWTNRAEMYVQITEEGLKDPLLCNNPTIDALVNTIGPISTAVTTWTATKVSEQLAVNAWNTYAGWVNGPEAAKLSGDALAAEQTRQAKLACIEAGMTLNATEETLLDAATVVYNFRKLNLTSTEDTDAFFANLSEENANKVAAWSDALQKNMGAEEGRQVFFEVIGIEKTNWKDVVPKLASYATTVAASSKQLANALEDKDLAKRLALGATPFASAQDKALLAAVDRLQLQTSTMLKAIPWLTSALTTKVD